MMTTLQLILLFVTAVNADAAGEPLSNVLYKELMENYQSDVIPIFEKNKAIEVRFQMSLMHVNSLDIHNNRFEATVWLHYDWKDERLKWNASEHNGVTSIRLKKSDLWAPDIQNYNSAGGDQIFDTHIVVYNDGTCTYVPPVKIVSHCIYDLTWFPYDEQICEFKYGSWTYDGTKVNLTTSSYIDTSMYLPRHGWDLTTTDLKRVVQIYECCPEAYISITYTIGLKRQGLKYAWEFISPAAILCFLVPILFLLPSDDPSRFVLGSGMLVTTMLMLSELGYILPDDMSSRPWLGVYYDMIFILLSLAMAVSAVISSISSRSKGSSTPPAIVKTIFLNGLSRVFCVTYDNKYGTPTGVDMDAQESNVAGGGEEWRLIAKVLDRLFFFIFLLIVIIGSLAILPK